MKRHLDWYLRSQRICLLHEDEDLLILDKPPGLLVLPDRYDRSLPNLYEGLQSELGEIFVVHRIDKETSGVLVLAKNRAAHRRLSASFEARKVEKIYLAIVRGLSSRAEGTVDSEIPLRDGAAVKVRAATSEFRVLEVFRKYSLIEVRPLTGRTHQIRIHLRSIGLPIVSDRLHGDGKPFFLSHIKPSYRPSAGGEKPLLERTALHAAQVRFEHPSTGQMLTIKSELPKDMRSVVRALRKYGSS